MGLRWGNHFSWSWRAETSPPEGITVRNGETLPWYRKGGQYRGAEIEALAGTESWLRLAAADLSRLSALHQQRWCGLYGKYRGGSYLGDCGIHPHLHQNLVILSKIWAFPPVLSTAVDVLTPSLAQEVRGGGYPPKGRMLTAATHYRATTTE